MAFTWLSKALSRIPPCVTNMANVKKLCYCNGTMSAITVIPWYVVNVGKACTPVFLSAFWMVYPVIAVFPLSLGSVHSRATLKPQVSTILMLDGGPGNSGEQVDKTIVEKTPATKIHHSP